MIEEKEKEKYRSIFKKLHKGMQDACREWAKLEDWDEETWVETLDGLLGYFEDYREAERWIRTHVLAKKR